MFLAPFNHSGINELLFNDDYLCAQIGQVGTQLDGLGHVGKRLRVDDGSEVNVFYNGVTFEEMKSPYGLLSLGIEKIKPYITRGILIDVAGYKKLDGQTLMILQPFLQLISNYPSPILRDFSSSDISFR